MAHTAYMINLAHPAQGFFPRWNDLRQPMSDAPQTKTNLLESRGMVSITTAAYYLESKPKTIRHLIDTGRLSAEKLGRELRISVKSLKKLAGE